MWRRIYQRKLLFWIGMYLSIAFGALFMPDAA